MVQARLPFPSIPVAHLLGTRVHALTADQLVDVIEAALVQGRRLIVGNHNVHSLALLQRCAQFQEFYNLCDVIFADGMPVVWIARLLGHPFERKHRMTSLDFIDTVFQRAVAHGCRVFYLGSAPGVIAEGVADFQRRIPGLQIDFRHGYFDMTPGNAEAHQVAELINGSRADLLVVGMGMPRQEHWIAQNHHALRPNVILPLGALADYRAGAIRTPPRWTGRVGLEWLFRLIAEPRRLGHRYLVEPWRLVPPLWRGMLDRPLRRRRESGDHR